MSSRSCSGYLSLLIPRRASKPKGRTHNDYLPPLPNFSDTAAIIPVGRRGPTSVHRALEIPEIRGQVFELLEWDDKKRTLAVMARVCRMFTEQALDALWRKLIGLKPLLALLPITIRGGVMVCLLLLHVCVRVCIHR
jgi:hypothetical protein